MIGEERERTIYRVTLVGSVCNAALLAFKGMAGFVGNSPAMVADAVHSLSDFVTDIMVLVFVRISSRPQDGGHPYGHGKYETLATALIGLSLMMVGVMLLWDAAVRIWGFAHGESLGQPRVVALVAAVVSVVVKEGVYWYTAYYGRRFKSQAMMANAWHHRSDALSSVATAAGIGGAIVLGEGWSVLDPLAAAVVSALIMRVAWALLRECVGELVDESLPEDELERIREIVGGVAEVEEPHNLRARHIGSRHSVEIHVRMDGGMTVARSHEVTREIESRIRAELGPDTLISVHVEPFFGEK